MFTQNTYPSLGYPSFLIPMPTPRRRLCRRAPQQPHQPSKIRRSKRTRKLRPLHPLQPFQNKLPRHYVFLHMHKRSQHLWHTNLDFLIQHKLCHFLTLLLHFYIYIYVIFIFGLLFYILRFFFALSRLLNLRATGLFCASNAISTETTQPLPRGQPHSLPTNRPGATEYPKLHCQEAFLYLQQRVCATIRRQLATV